MHDETSERRPQSPKADPPRSPTEAELSRIAREAVHQPADARLDKQLVRLGVMDATELAESQPPQPSRSAAIDPELERLREELRTTKVMVRLLIAVIAVLAIAVIVLLIR